MKRNMSNQKFYVIKDDRCLDVFDNKDLATEYANLVGGVIQIYD